MFPLEVSSLEQLGLMVNATKESNLWHLKYGHLHIQGLKSLSNKGLVKGLPSITEVDLCEICLMGK